MRAPQEGRTHVTGDGVLVELRVAGGDTVGELVSLTTWLQSQRELQGRVRAVTRTPGSEELGGGVELLTVALGSGGVGVVLARAVTVWLTNRKSDVSITVTSENRSVTVEAKRVADALPLLEEVLRHETAPGDEA
ncbi:effector-associated constant component EACC1 [Nonomuraea dietziae]|uniref:effector-associated constant component EACC1 n=1 Tax=Nonomuraea dietziae TaxID=65515 RepID=UPI003440EE1F